MQIVLFDTSISHRQLYPLSLTKPVCDLRQGIFTLRELWAMNSGQPIFALTMGYLQQQIPPDAAGYICISSSVRPSRALMDLILALKPGAMLEDENGIIAFASAELPIFDQFPLFFRDSRKLDAVPRITHPADFFKSNAAQIMADANRLPNIRRGTGAHATNTVFGEGLLYIEEGVIMNGCTLNTADGPIFIGRNALVMEGTLIRGPVSIGEGAVVKMGTRIYAGTTIGKYCTVGGEIKNSILMDYSNKAHDGYLGDSVIGSWCNLGAGTSNSNLKNNASPVKMWHQSSRSFEPVGIKAGVIIGDYSRCAINTSLNTGTTIGVCCSVHGAGYPAKHVASFSWGLDEKYNIEKAIKDIVNWKSLKNMEIQPDEIEVLRYIFERR